MNSKCETVKHPWKHMWNILYICMCVCVCVHVCVCVWGGYLEHSLPMSLIGLTTDLFPSMHLAVGTGLFQTQYPGEKEREREREKERKRDEREREGEGHMREDTGSRTHR